MPLIHLALMQLQKHQQNYWYNHTTQHMIAIPSLQDLQTIMAHNNLQKNSFQKPLFWLKKTKKFQFMVAVKTSKIGIFLDRKSTRLNSSHVAISYAVFCLKKKTKNKKKYNIKKTT